MDKKFAKLGGPASFTPPKDYLRDDKLDKLFAEGSIEMLESERETLNKWREKREDFVKKAEIDLNDVQTLSDSFDTLHKSVVNTANEHEVDNRYGAVGCLLWWAVLVVLDVTWGSFLEDARRTSRLFL